MYFVKLLQHHHLHVFAIPIKMKKISDFHPVHHAIAAALLNGKERAHPKECEVQIDKSFRKLRPISLAAENDLIQKHCLFACYTDSTFRE